MRVIFSLFLLSQAARVNHRAKQTADTELRVDAQVESDLELSEKLEDQDEADVASWEQLEESADEQIEEVELSNVSNADAADAESGRVEVKIGPSFFSRKKCVLHDDAHRMTCEANAGNRGHRLNNDKTRRRRKEYIFEITVEGDEICAERTNKGSWGLWLNIECTLKSVPVYALDGCPKKGDRLKDQTLADSDYAKVRCCSYDVSQFPFKKCVSGGDSPVGTIGCKTQDYYAARDTCAAHGMRLCSWYEMKHNDCCGTGCGFDTQRVWVIAESYGKSQHDFNANHWPTAYQARLALSRATTTTTTTTAPAVAWPLYALDGCPKTTGGAERLRDKRMTKYDVAAVRCCSYHGNTCDSRTVGCKTATYNDAELACKAAGKRLCSWHEMKANTCCGTGCNFDLKLAWVIPESYGKSPADFNPDHWHGSGSHHDYWH